MNLHNMTCDKTVAMGTRLQGYWLWSEGRLKGSLLGAGVDAPKWNLGKSTESYRVNPTLKKENMRPVVR